MQEEKPEAITNMSEKTESEPPLQAESSSVQLDQNDAICEISAPPRRDDVIPACSQGQKLEGTTEQRRVRVHLRDLFMFLLILNWCIWLLRALQGSVFEIHPYASIYFRPNAWNVMTSLTGFLTGFLKLHSAACMFKIWLFI